MQEASRRRRAIAAALLAATLAATASPFASAQADYPSHRITLVVPAAPGGGLDATARFLSTRMAAAWGEAAIVENQGGADGLIATQRVIKAAPDGYTMLLQIPSLLLLKHNTSVLASDPATALLPVSELGVTPSVVAVSSKLPVHSVRELVAYCNAAKAPCTWGSGQQLSYLYGKRLFAVSGIKETTNIPYKGTAPVITDLLGGQITIAITSIASPLPYHTAGSLRILAVNAEKRSAQVPDVPTFREAGLDVPPRGSWYGLFVPRGTPPEVIAKVEKLMTSLARDPAASELMRSLGAEPVFGSSEEFAAGVRDESAFLDTLVKQYSLN
jgi:tripartite-type tricarboxylate transporter receptor subunit TctC